jgi:hypothetical protein
MTEIVEIWMQRIEAWLWLAYLEAIEWLVLAADLRRRIELLANSIDVLDRELDIMSARRPSYGVN